jgi:hypothetical protein
LILGTKSPLGCAVFPGAGTVNFDFAFGCFGFLAAGLRDFAGADFFFVFDLGMASP